MINFRKYLSMGLILSCALSFAACGSDDSSSYDPLPKEDTRTYDIRVCQDDNSDTTNAITQGFTDALIDLFGQEHIHLDVQTADSRSASEICTAFASDVAQLIFTVGEDSLTAAAQTITDLPVVASNVMDFERILHIITPQGEDWDGTTGRNITGVSNLTSIPQQTSMLIETTKDLRAVGILYCTEDQNAVFQNEMLETYLDEAGIPWKEYAIPSTSAADISSGGENPANVIVPSRFSAASGKEGANTDVVTFGENSQSTGINSPASVRTPQISSNWSDDLTPEGLAPLPEDASAEQIAAYAAAECSALYISAGSMLTAQIDVITSAATAAGKVTVGGDATLGQSTLVSMYADPYAQGYAAGKQVYRILVNGDDPGAIAIDDVATEDNVKLYNGNVAATLGLDFPKSFKEIHEYLETYVIGSDTERIEPTEEE